MKLKNLFIAVVVLAALSAAVFVARRPAAPVSADPRIGQPLAGRAVIEQAAKLRLSDQGKTVTLIRQPDATWRVAGYFDLPADFPKLSSFIGSLADAKIQRLVTRSPERLARLGFKDTRLELLDAAGNAVWSVTLGKRADTGGGRYVRFGEEDRAYLTDFNPWLDVEPKNWADSQILNLKPEEIARIDIAFAGAAPVTLSRANKDGTWTADKTPAVRKVNADKVTAVLNTVGSVRFSDTVDPTDGRVAEARAHQRVFTLTTFAGKTYTVALGRKPEEKKPRPSAPAAKTTGAAPAAKAAAAPEYETVPAGPLFVFIASSDPAAPVNAFMKKRAFEISDYQLSTLPQTPADLFAPVPPPPAPAVAPKEFPGKPHSSSP